MPTKGNAGQPTQEIAISNETMIYILSGIAVILLLVLCFILGFWCYRRSHHKRIKRLFTVAVITYDETVNKLVIAKLGQRTGEILNVLEFYS